MRTLVKASLFLCLMVLAATPSWADDKRGTREEAKAMAEKAAALVKENPQKAFAKFQEKDGGFIDRDLYVFVLDGKGFFTAHGVKPALVGKDGINMKDANGFEFMKAFIAVKDTGWVDYRWPDPTEENKVKDKSSYIVKVGDYAIGVGYYK
jgi:cytochrome c